MTPPTCRNVWVPAAALCAAWALSGCIQQRPKPLTADAFLAPREAYDRSRVQPVDQAGPLPYDGTSPPTAAETKAPPEAPESMSGVSPTVEQSVRPVQEEGFQLPEPGADSAPDDGRPPADSGDASAAQPGATPPTGVTPTTAPAATAGQQPDPPAGARASTRPAGGSGASASGPSGGYQVVGTVLADVNSAPIFADKVLGVLDKALAAAARKLDERQFRAAAAELIMKQVREYVATELEFAMAKSRLEAKDQQLASGAATKWREDQITKAGGSEEVARQQWAARGLDFEEQVEEQYRTYMVQLFYQRKEYPKIQVSAEDKRRYYQEHVAREFSQPEAARFRVIFVDPRKRGGRNEALAEVNRLLDRARGGAANFTELANGQENDNPSFRLPAGRDGWISRGAFVLPEVEQSVWKLRPGQVSDVIETPNGFYVAKLEEIQAGTVRPFGDALVQKRIEKTLSDQQFGALRARAQQRLIHDAIIRYHPDEQTMIRTAVEMAAQKYRFWRTAAAR